MPVTLAKMSLIPHFRSDATLIYSLIQQDASTSKRIAKRGQANLFKLSLPDSHLMLRSLLMSSLNSMPTFL